MRETFVDGKANNPWNLCTAVPLCRSSVKRSHGGGRACVCVCARTLKKEVVVCELEQQGAVCTTIRLLRKLPN